MKENTKRGVLIAIALLIVIPIVCKLLQLGKDFFDDSRKEREDSTVYTAGDVMENGKMELILNRAVVEKTPEKVYEPYLSYEARENLTSLHSEIKGEDLPVQMDEKGNLTNDMSYVKLYFTMTSTDEERTRFRFDFPLMGGSHILSNSKLYSDRWIDPANQKWDIPLEPGEEKDFVLTFIVYDGDIETYRDDLYLTVQLPFNPEKEYEPVPRKFSFSATSGR